MDDLAVFGYMTNTLIKFILILQIPTTDNYVLKDQEIKNVSLLIFGMDKSLDETIHVVDLALSAGG